MAELIWPFQRASSLRQHAISIKQAFKQKFDFNAISGRSLNMTMCNQESQQANALITAQSQGTILVMVAWFLACLLVSFSDVQDVV